MHHWISNYQVRGNWKQEIRRISWIWGVVLAVCWFAEPLNAQDVPQTKPFLYQTKASVKAPVPIIFDTDIGGDVDDLLALGLIHTLANRKECELLAVTLSLGQGVGPAYLELINRYFGRPFIPIGTISQTLSPGGEGLYSGLTLTEFQHLGLCQSDPRDKPLVGFAPLILRKVLSEAQDGSVVLIQVGTSINLARLLDTPGDGYSPLKGRDLVAKKVKLVSIMAGVFGGKPFPESNVVANIKMAQKLINDCPVPMVFSGFEIGNAIPVPGLSLIKDYNYVKAHPVQTGYYYYAQCYYKGHMERPRPSWDLTSVLYAVRPDRSYFGISEPGTVSIDDKGFSTFKADPAGKHRYLTATFDQCAAVRELFIQLCSEPGSASGFLHGE